MIIVKLENSCMADCLGMADWSALPGSAVVVIARSLQLIEDFIALRATCSSWLKATTLNDFYTSSSSSCPKLPLLMLEHFEERTYFDEEESRLLELRLESLRHVQSEDPEANHQNDEMDENHQMDENDHDEKMDDDDEVDDDYEDDEVDDDEVSIDLSLDQSKDPEADEIDDMVQRKDLDDQHKFKRLIQREGPEANHERKFLSLSKGKTCNISFPEAKGMEYRGSKGWLIMVERSTDNMCLFHPISRLHIPLPKVPIHLNPEGWMILPKNFISAVLSARPSETSDYVVMVVFMEERRTAPGCGVLQLTHTWFWKPGNLTWTEVDIPFWVEDLNYYNGKFYALTIHAEVWMCDISGPNPKASKILKLPWKVLRPDAQLVECGGRLLIVAPYYRYHHDMRSEYDLEMGEIDVIKGSYNIITSLGSSAVFLGHSEGFSIDANEFPGIIQPNSIYFGEGSYQVATPGPNHESEPNFCFDIWLNF